MKPIKQKFMMIDSIRVTVRDKNGKIKSDHIINNGRWHRFLCKIGLAHNSITNNGMAACAALIGNVASAPAAFQYVGIGSGTVASGATDAWLGSATCVASATSITRVSTTVTNDTLQLVYTFGSTAGGGSLTGTYSVDEVIVANGSGTTGFSASGTHIALLRQVYTPVDSCQFSQGDTIAVTVKIQVKQGV
jgi:hypothetical protein